MTGALNWLFWITGVWFWGIAAGFFLFALGRLAFGRLRDLKYGGSRYGTLEQKAALDEQERLARDVFGDRRGPTLDP